jgi:hypothetical protein
MGTQPDVLGQALSLFLSKQHISHLFDTHVRMLANASLADSVSAIFPLSLFATLRGSRCEPVIAGFWRRRVKRVGRRQVIAPDELMVMLVGIVPRPTSGSISSGDDEEPAVERQTGSDEAPPFLKSPYILDFEPWKRIRR